jgi:hypothetical protein
MRPWKPVLVVVGLVILLGFFSNGRQNGRPRAGETVTPNLEGPVRWTAGTMGELGVRLVARAADAKRARVLDFSAVPWRVNPVANIAFYCGDQPLRSLEVALSHRC